MHSEEGSEAKAAEDTSGQGGSRGSGGSRFDFGKLVKDVAVNSVIGGFASMAFYGMDRAVERVSRSVTRGSQRRIENESRRINTCL